MASLAEIIAAEDAVKVLEKRRTQIQEQIQRIEGSVANLTRSLDEATRSVTFHTNNRRHSQREADVVDVNEYSRVLHQLSDARAMVSDRQIMLAQAKDTIVKLKEQAVAVEADIRQRKIELQQTGKVIRVDVAVWRRTA